MRKLNLLSTLLILAMFCGSISHAQDFSNKGKDFWVAYGYHQVMTVGNQQQMVLYFAAEQNSNVTVTIPGLGYSQNYFVPANTVVTTAAIPKNAPQDARLLTASTAPENKGIHITSDKPIVAYSHIYNQNVSGASILFPTNTLGKEYYSVNYTNISNSNNANCWFYVVATDAGTTTVEITPSADCIGHPAGVPFRINLTQGQVYNVMGNYSGNFGVDLTGSKIESINNGDGCKKIGVFSGSGRISITCNGSQSSSDNYMSQAFPKTAWGKKYLTASTGGGNINNIYRICVSDPTTVVTVNGAPIAVPLQIGFYYELPASSIPYRIEADKPIMVAQYIPSQVACGNSGPADPEVIYLSSVEQNISRVLWNATPNSAITGHYYNVIISNQGTAISSFTLDGVTVPPGAFTVHPQDPNYSYMIQAVTAGQHTIQSDSGFNAIAYGFGNAESYGYNAGTNIKDIYQYITLQNPVSTVNFPATCRNSDFYFTMTFPYQPTSIDWLFNGLFPDFLMPNPATYFIGTIVVGTRTLYQYRIPTPYNIATPGTYPIKIVATNPTPDNCGGTQEIDFDLVVYDLPTSDYNFTTDGCVTNPVQFNDLAVGNGRPITGRYWNFGDPASGANNTSALQNPTHTFTAAGGYNVKYTVSTDIGCKSDTITKLVTLNNPPTADFTTAGTYCDGNTISFTDASSAGVTNWTWNFGDPASGANNTSTLANPTHIFSGPGTYTVTLTVSTGTCQSLPYTFNVTIYPKPTSNFTFPAVVCLPSGSTQFTDASIPGAGNTITSWAWDFGDPASGPNNTSNLQNPIHIYSATGSYPVTLTIITNNGCTDTKVINVNSVYAEPTAAFNSVPAVCIGSVIGFSDASTAPGSTVTGWSWNFGDPASGPNNTSNAQNPSHIYATAGTYTVTLTVTSAVGCASVNNTATGQVVVRPLPTASMAGNSIVCLNATQPVVTFTGNGGTAPYTFTYTINGGLPQTVTSPANSNIATLNVPTNVAGIFQYALVSVQEGSSTACQQGQPGTATIEVKPLPTATIAGNTIVCLNAPQPLITFTGAGGSAPYTFTYTIGGGPQQTISTTGASSTVTIAVPTNTAGLFTYNLIRVQEGSTNACIQDQPASVSVEVKALPTGTISGAGEICLNGTPDPVITFTGNNGSPNYTFTYTINGGPAQTVTTTSGNTVTVNVPTTTAGVFTYNLVNVQEGSAQACAQNQAGSAIVTVNPLPTADFNFTIPSCQTRTIAFTDASVPNAGNLVSWTWDFGDGSPTSNLQNPTHTYPNTGTYTVTLSIATDKGCTRTNFTKQVTINTRPQAGFISPEVCLTDINTPFTDTSKISTGTIVGWEWNFGDPGSGINNTSTLQNPTHTYSATGNYTVMLVVISDQGCRDTINQTFTVNGSIPVAGFTLQNTGALCSNQDITIKDGSSVNFGSITKVEVFWDYLNDPTIKTTEDNPTPGQLFTHTYPEFGTPATRTFQVRYVAYSGASCVNVFTRDITLLATPTIQFDAVPYACDKAPSFQVTQAQVINGLPGTGVFTGTAITSAGVFSPSVAGTGLHTIRYTFTGTNGCINFKEQVIDVSPTPGANAGPDKVVLEGGQVMLTPVQNAGITVTYLWTPPTGLNDPTQAFATASPTTDMTYTLTVTSDKGCSASDDVFVKLLKKVAIPNIFSPNGDGVHDKWVIQYLESYPGCTVEIFNRYGQRIYSSVGYGNPWDGTVNGKPVPVGTYYYIVNPKNGRSQMSGYVDVIR